MTTRGSSASFPCRFGVVACAGVGPGRSRGSFGGAEARAAAAANVGGGTAGRVLVADVLDFAGATGTNSGTGAPDAVGAGPTAGAPERALACVSSGCFPRSSLGGAEVRAAPTPTVVGVAAGRVLVAGVLDLAGATGTSSGAGAPDTVGAGLTADAPEGGLELGGGAEAGGEDD